MLDVLIFIVKFIGFCWLIASVFVQYTIDSIINEEYEKLYNEPPPEDYSSIISIVIIWLTKSLLQAPLIAYALITDEEGIREEARFVAAIIRKDIG